MCIRDRVLVPLPLAELDANQEISWQQDFDENSFAYLEYVQTLTGLVQPAEQLKMCIRDSFQTDPADLHRREGLFIVAV